jgi:hypothetical protein
MGFRCLDRHGSLKANAVAEQGRVTTQLILAFDETPGALISGLRMLSIFACVGSFGWTNGRIRNHRTNGGPEARVVCAKIHEGELCLKPSLSQYSPALVML